MKDILWLFVETSGLDWEDEIIGLRTYNKDEGSKHYRFACDRPTNPTLKSINGYDPKTWGANADKKETLIRIVKNRIFSDSWFGGHYLPWHFRYINAEVKRLNAGGPLNLSDYQQIDLMRIVDPFVQLGVTESRKFDDIRDLLGVAPTKCKAETASLIYDSYLKSWGINA